MSDEHKEVICALLRAESDLKAKHDRNLHTHDEYAKFYEADALLIREAINIVTTAPRAFQAALSAAEQRAEARGRDAEVGAAIQRAAGELPENFEIEMGIERGSASVYMRNSDAETVCMDVDADNRLAAEINAAIDAALASVAVDSSERG